MQSRILIFLNTLLAFGALSGCGSSLDRVEGVRPDGGATKVFDHGYDIVYPAALRVMHLNNEKVEEAVPETGRIVSLQTFGTRAVFLTKLPGGRTRVELSASMHSWWTGNLSGGKSAFFTLLREQIVVFEKKKIRKELLSKKKGVDKDLRNIYKSDEGSDKSETPSQTLEPAPTPSRRHRLRR